MSNSRRKFLKQSAAVAGGFFIVPRHVLGKGYTAPSDQLNIAGIGGGGKGEVDIPNSWNNGKNNIGAICDVDWARAKKMMDKFPNAKRYRDYREMLDKEKDIDAVIVTTPDHTHAVIATAAMQLNKHVYVQKPLTHDIYEARVLTEMARKQKVVTQMGNQGASSEAVQLFSKWFQDGMIGKVHTVQVWTNRPVWPQGIPVPTNKPTLPKDMLWDNWIGPAQMVDFHPAYHPFKWRGWWAFGTGALGDMGCHLLDPPYRALGLGYPTEAEGSAGTVYTKDWTAEYLPDSCPPSSQVTLKFPKTAKNKSEVTLSWSDGGIRPARPAIIPADDKIGSDDGGVIMIGTKGVMTCGIFGWYGRVYKFNGEKIKMPDNLSGWELSKDDFGHQAKWADACKAGFGSKEHLALTSSFDYSGPFSETVLMGNLALRSLNVRNARKGGGFDYPGDKKLLWDGANLKITNFDEANAFVKSTYRDGWKMSGV
jgi:predicted dehydrogenase